MASKEYILYDLASKDEGGSKAWSLNPWKTRLNLNYKGLDYKTVWLDYPDIKPTLKPHFKEELPMYTCPSLAFPSGEYLNDSLKIAHKLEQEHPQPSLHLDSEYVDKMQETLLKGLHKIVGVAASQVPKRLLNEASLKYWRETREQRIGMTLEEAEKNHSGPHVFLAAAPEFKEIGSWYKKSDGPFLTGNEPCFGDFQWAGFLIFLQRIGDDVWGWFKDAVGDDVVVHQKLLDAVKPWSERDTY